MLNLAVLASTAGTDLQGIIDAIESGRLEGVTVNVVISNHEDAGALEKARGAGIDAVFIDAENLKREAYDQKISEELQRRQIDLVAAIGYLRLFSPWFVDKYRNKIINIHPSLLPSFPGMDLNVHQAVIDAGVKLTGCTLHFIDEGMDTGPIIMQRSIPIEPEETPESLKPKVQALEIEVLIDALGKFRDKKISISGQRVQVKA